MKTVLIAVLTAAVVTLAILYFRPASPVLPDLRAELGALQQQVGDLRTSMLQRPVDLVVVLTQSGAQCRSQTTPHSYAYPSQPVRWWIVNMNCDLDGREVEIRFADGNTPLDVKQPKHQTFIRTRVRGNAAVGIYKYALWAVGKAGDYQLEDPELEIGDI